MSHSSKKTASKPAVKQPEASVIELHEKDLPVNPAPSAVITSRSNTSIYIIMVFAVLLISLQTLSVIGWILLVISGIMLVVGKNLKQFAFYPDFLVIYALDQSGLCWKVAYQTVKSWHLKRAWFGFSTLAIETEGNTAQKIEAKSYQYYALNKAMKAHLASKESKNPESSDPAKD